MSAAPSRGAAAARRAPAVAATRRGTVALLALLCLGVTLALYAEALPFAFVGDDVWFVRPNPHWLRGALVPSADWHYYPLNQILLYALPALTGRHPEVMHALNFLLHSGIGVGVFLLLRRLGFGGLAALVAAVWFLSRGVGYEVVAWITELSYLCVVAYTLVSLATWDRYLRGEGERYRVATVVVFTVALLTIEHALLLVPLYLLLELVVHPERSPLLAPPPRGGGLGARAVEALRGSLRYLPFAVVVVAFLSIKLAFQGGLTWSTVEHHAVEAPAPVPSGEAVTSALPPERRWLGMLNTPLRAYRDLLVNAGYLFLPSPLLGGAEANPLTARPGLALVPWLAAHVAVLLLGGRRGRFLLLWIYLYLLPLAVAGVPQARYHYMATVPAAGLVGWAWAALWTRSGRRPGAAAAVATAVFLAALLAGERSFIRARLAEWRTASELVQSAVEQLERDLGPGVRRVAYLNLPRAAPSPFFPAWAFNNAAPFLPVMARPPRPEVEVRVLYDRTFVAGRWPTIGRYAAPGEIETLSREPGTLAYRFAAEPPRIERLAPPPGGGLSAP